MKKQSSEQLFHFIHHHRLFCDIIKMIKGTDFDVSFSKSLFLPVLDLTVRFLLSASPQSDLSAFCCLLPPGRSVKSFCFLNLAVCWWFPQFLTGLMLFWVTRVLLQEVSWEAGCSPLVFLPEFVKPEGRFWVDKDVIVAAPDKCFRWF